MKKFEYKVLEIKPKSAWTLKTDYVDLNDTLNELGKQGWELVSSYPNAEYSLIVILKKELPY